VINNQVKLEDKLALLELFYKDVWDTDLIQSKNPGKNVYTAEYMLNKINNSAFPALEMLEAENHWMKARMYYYMAGDESMLHMEGDPVKEEEERKFIETLDREAIIDKALEECDYDNPTLVEHEKKTGSRFVRFPKEVKTTYVGWFKSYENDILTIIDIDLFDENDRMLTKSFTPFDIQKELDKVDLTKPIMVITNKYIVGDTESTEKICSIEQTS
jgi:hypothetical protein